MKEREGQQERKALEEQVDKLRSQISADLLPKCAKLQNRADELSASLQNAETHNAKKTQQFDLERATWAATEQALQDSLSKLQSQLEQTTQELEATEEEKATALRNLEDECAVWGGIKLGLEKQIEALTRELEEQAGQVEIVQVQVTKAQRSVREVQQAYDNSESKHLQHRNRTLEKLAGRLVRNTVKDEFDSWRGITQAILLERKVAWVEEEDLTKQREIMEALAMAAALEEEVRELRTAGQDWKMTALERSRGCIYRVQAAADAVAEGLVKANRKLEEKAQELQKKAEEAEANLTQYVKRMALELTNSQAEQERLGSKVAAVLAEKSSMKHDFATMMDELESYRARLGEKGFAKLSPRVQRSARPPVAIPPEYEDEDEKERFQAEQKYMAKPGKSSGKYFMC